MGESGGFNGEIELPGGSFSRLLLLPDDIIEPTSSYSSSSSSVLFSSNTPKMLCFGDFTCANVSTTLHHHNTTNKRRNGSGQESGSSRRNVQKNVRKKNKLEMEPNTTTITTTTNLSHAKGKREKLGERITTLQQLVCPYGKTDTASVLHEAMGYIRFLQDQVKVLSSPYLQHLPTSSSPSPQHALSFSENSLPISATAYDPTKCLRNRGLCLVPVECITDLANVNGADIWSPATSLTTTTTSTVVAPQNSN
ncbi:hypothetical protein vseg_018665 [Gypsophila vaccaria]